MKFNVIRAKDDRQDIHDNEDFYILESNNHGFYVYQRCSEIGWYTASPRYGTEQEAQNAAALLADPAIAHDAYGCYGSPPSPGCPLCATR